MKSTSVFYTSVQLNQLLSAAPMTSNVITTHSRLPYLRLRFGLVEGQKWPTVNCTVHCTFEAAPCRCQAKRQLCESSARRTWRAVEFGSVSESLATRLRFSIATRLARKCTVCGAHGRSQGPCIMHHGSPAVTWLGNGRGS
jgi:hypothetical protein